jgi:hypothetical protein
MRRRSIQIAAGLGTLVAPLATWAQATTSGFVTTGPLRAPAPALGMPLIVMLAVALAGVAMYRLRRTVGGLVVGFVLVAVTVLAGLGYAIMPPLPITISGADCMKATVNVFDPSTEPTTLMSACPNPIQIVDIQISCGRDVFLNSETNTSGAIDMFPLCKKGQILANGDACDLPTCAHT